MYGGDVCDDDDDDDDDDCNGVFYHQKNRLFALKMVYQFKCSFFYSMGNVCMVWWCQKWVLRVVGSPRIMGS